MSTSANAPQFGLIGHADSWAMIANLVNGLRSDSLDRLTVDQVRDIVPWIPPRSIFRVHAWSHPSGQAVEGVYIESFISPDELTPDFTRSNIRKVKEAADYALKEGVRIASLGGFTSIVLEGRSGLLPQGSDTYFTTGNTLTVALIVKGVERAAQLHHIRMPKSRLLVIGSTGDVGSGCVKYLASRVGEVLLCARNENRLSQQRTALLKADISCSMSTKVEELLPVADVIICAANLDSPTFVPDHCQPGTLICDAGYPKNMRASETASATDRLFYGGMGQLLGGLEFEPDTFGAFYKYPAPFVAHGCMLEAILLAMEGRFEAYTTGTNRITVEKVDEIWRLAREHGLDVSPFFNHKGLWAS